MITFSIDMPPKKMRAWAAGKPPEIRGAVQNYLGSLRRVKQSAHDMKASERLEINRGVLLAEADKLTHTSDH